MVGAAIASLIARATLATVSSGRELYMGRLRIPSASRSVRRKLPRTDGEKAR